MTSGRRARRRFVARDRRGPRADVRAGDLRRATPHCPQCPDAQVGGHRWSVLPTRSVDRLCGSRPGRPDRPATGRPMAGRCGWSRSLARYTSNAILAEEQRVLSWALDAQLTSLPSLTVETAGLDMMQADAARAVAGVTASSWWSAQQEQARPRCSPAPSTTWNATAAGCSGWPQRPRRPGCWDTRPGWRRTRWPSSFTSGPAPTGYPSPTTGSRLGATLIVDEASMLGTSSLARLVGLAQQERWRLVLVGDPRQLQAVGRGGCSPSCAQRPTSTS